MELIDFLIYGLATWRLSSLLVREDGPFSLFGKLREWTGIEHDENGDVEMIPERFLPELLSCVWCCSIWVALFWLLFWMLLPFVALRVAIVFGLSTVAVLVDERVSGH